MVAKAFYLLVAMVHLAVFATSAATAQEDRPALVGVIDQAATLLQFCGDLTQGALKKGCDRAGKFVGPTDMGLDGAFENKGLVIAVRDGILVEGAGLAGWVGGMVVCSPAGGVAVMCGAVGRYAAAEEMEKKLTPEIDPKSIFSPLEIDVAALPRPPADAPVPVVVDVDPEIARPTSTRTMGDWQVTTGGSRVEAWIPAMDYSEGISAVGMICDAGSGFRMAFKPSQPDTQFTRGYVEGPDSPIEDDDLSWIHLDNNQMSPERSVKEVADIVAFTKQALIDGAAASDLAHGYYFDEIANVTFRVGDVQAIYAFIEQNCEAPSLPVAGTDTGVPQGFLQALASGDLDTADGLMMQTLPGWLACKRVDEKTSTCSAGVDLLTQFGSYVAIRYGTGPGNFYVDAGFSFNRQASDEHPMLVETLLKVFMLAGYPQNEAMACIGEIVNYGLEFPEPYHSTRSSMPFAFGCSNGYREYSKHRVVVEGKSQSLF